MIHCVAGLRMLQVFEPLRHKILGKEICRQDFRKPKVLGLIYVNSEAINDGYHNGRMVPLPNMRKAANLPNLVGGHFNR